ncbi:MAG: serine/threonine protein kinase [Deltaproteobacteria bacterium]|nr:serine/threonine protein kinase [Deltaproteobacteria bacterium]
MTDKNKLDELSRIPSREDFAVAFDERFKENTDLKKTKVGVIAPGSVVDPFMNRVIDGKYKVERLLGGGGMGNVYLAKHMVIEKKVAIKVLHPELAKKASVGKRFLQEAKAASSIEHENIVQIMDYGKTEDGFTYMVMEYLQGMELGNYIQKHGALDWKTARDIIIQVAKALGAAHARNIIHRDIKPSNIFLIDFAGKSNFVKIIDFGIAKVGQENDGEKMTKTGTIMGTPDYMSPEQAGGKDLTSASDIYSTGIILFELLAGKVPFEADSFMAVLSMHLFDAPPKVSEINTSASIPSVMDSIILKSLEKKAEDRFNTMDELIDALNSISDDGIARKITVKSHMRRSRRKLLILLSSLAALGAAAVMGLWIVKNIGASPEESSLRGLGVSVPDMEIDVSEMKIESPRESDVMVTVTANEKDASIVVESGVVSVKTGKTYTRFGKGAVLGTTPLKGLTVKSSNDKIKLKITKAGFDTSVFDVKLDSSLTIEKILKKTHKRTVTVPMMKPIPMKVFPMVHNNGELLTPMFED